MVDAAGTKEPVRVTYSRRLRRPAGPVAGRQDARVDVEPRRRIRRPAVPRAVESREGARGAEARAADESRQENHDRVDLPLALTRVRRRRCADRRSQPRRRARRRDRATACRDAGVADASKAASTGSNGERLAGDYIVAAAERIGAKPLPGADGLPVAVRVHRRHARRRLDARPSPSTDRRSLAAADRACSALSFSDNGDVDGAGRVRRLRHRRAGEPGLRLRQLRDARRQGQDRPRAALLPRRRGSEDARRSSRATPTCATRRWPRGSTARRRCSSSPGRARRTPASWRR